MDGKPLCDDLQYRAKHYKCALNDESWILAMQDEFNQFKRNEVWNIVPWSKDKSAIGTKWVYRNKLSEDGKVMCDKVRLGAKGNYQEEGINFDEIYA